jgi:hypothetical protein
MEVFSTVVAVTLRRAQQHVQMRVQGRQHIVFVCGLLLAGRSDIEGYRGIYCVSRNESGDRGGWDGLSGAVE